MHRFKYGRDASLSSPLGAMLVRNCPLVIDHDVAVPVPLHLDRLRWRGFNQSVLLTHALCRPAGVPIDPFALRRIRPTARQVGLDDETRKCNVRRAFEVTGQSALVGKRVLLVDDVLTTGATANECARALRAAGAKSVDVVVLARVLAP